MVIDKVESAWVTLWGDRVGAVSWLKDRACGVFEYDPSFLKKGRDISPLHMGIDAAGRGDRVYMFPNLNRETFLGLPGLLADALPDKFGNWIIDAWLTRNGRDAANFSPVERLCYTGRRAMGALEFEPALTRRMNRAVPVEIDRMVELTQAILSQRISLNVELGKSEKENKEALLDILRIGTSAGGARAKAVIAMNAAGHVVSGQADIPEDYEHWIIKFDGVDDLELGKPGGYGRIEYAYHQMALAAGIQMTQCRLLEENGRAHFLTKRFDREKGQKVHLQSLCGLAHYDFNMAGAYGYEQAFAVMRKLRLTKIEAVEQYRRMVFNVLARNQDDHTKNIAFLMDRNGKWRLSPAFDVIFSHNPAGLWTHQHQMTINSKRDGFHRQDLIQVGESIGISKPMEIIRQVADAVSRWPTFAMEAGIPREVTVAIGRYHRMDLFS